MLLSGHPGSTVTQAIKGVRNGIRTHTADRCSILANIIGRLVLHPVAFGCAHGRTVQALHLSGCLMGPDVILESQLTEFLPSVMALRSSRGNDACICSPS